MALIHEELYKGGGLDELNFSPYIEKLAEDLFQTYRFGNPDISLNIAMEESIFLDMDIAVPLGIIVNELVSNSLKHAFTGRDKGEIRIALCREKPVKYVNSTEESKKETSKGTDFLLTVSDNGIGTPASLDLENLDSLGLHLVASLVEQLDGELEIKRDGGTEFTIRFTVAEKNNQIELKE
jgi:two-component sensor histidine kinase